MTRSVLKQELFDKTLESARLTEKERNGIRALIEEGADYINAAARLNTTPNALRNITYRVRFRYQRNKKYCNSIEYLSRRLGAKSRILTG